MTYASEVLADSPLAYWRLGEASGSTMVDSFGSGRHGTYVNSPTLGAASLIPSDPADTSVDFDGVNDLGYVSYAAWMNSASFTVEALFRPDSVTGSHVVVARHNTSSAGDAVFILRTDGDRLSFYIYAAGFGVVQSAVGSIAVGSTYHAAATYGGGTMRLYLNGSEVASGSRSAPGSLSTPLTIGANSGTTLEAFDGRIDEVAFYGSALSAARIAAHHDALFATSADGTLSTTLPVPTIAMSGTAPTPGALAATLPVLTMALSGSSPIPGEMSLTLPVLEVAAAGTTPPARSGFGLVLDSTATVTAEPPLEAFPPGPGGVPDPVQHIITPTVPAPTLVNGRPS